MQEILQNLPLKFCKNCAHYRATIDPLKKFGEDIYLYTCLSAHNLRARDLVNAQPIFHYASCAEARVTSPDSCGLEAYWYEQKAPPFIPEKTQAATAFKPFKKFDI